ASTALVTSCHSSSGECAPPGERQPMATIAIGSLVVVGVGVGGGGGVGAPVGWGWRCWAGGWGGGWSKRRVAGRGSPGGGWGRGVEGVAELEGGEGVEAVVFEGVVGVDGVGGGVAEDGGGVGAHEGEQVVVLFWLGEDGELVGEAGGVDGGGAGLFRGGGEGAQEWGKG